MKIVINLQPITKENSKYIQYKKDCRKFLSFHQLGVKQFKPIDYPINLKVVYYMQTRSKVDLCNLLASTCDILVKYKVISNSNCKVVISHNGSEVRYDKTNPRCVIEIDKVEVDPDIWV